MINVITIVSLPSETSAVNVNQHKSDFGGDKTIHRAFVYYSTEHQYSFIGLFKEHIGTDLITGFVHSTPLTVNYTGTMRITPTIVMMGACCAKQLREPRVKDA